MKECDMVEDKQQGEITENQVVEYYIMTPETDVM